MRAGLALALAALAIVALGAALRQPGETRGFLPAGSTGIVVLDVSASISSDTYARIAATLDRLADSNGRYGLVLFSDAAYVALPPGTPAAELRPFERFFRVPAPTDPGLLPQPREARGRTRSAPARGSRLGLRLALDVIRRERLGRPAVLLVSDLDDDARDLESLTTVMLDYERRGVPLRVVGLNPSPEDERFVRRLLRRPEDLVAATLPGERTASASAAFARPR